MATARCRGRRVRRALRKLARRAREVATVTATLEHVLLGGARAAQMGGWAVWQAALYSASPSRLLPSIPCPIYPCNACSMPTSSSWSRQAFCSQQLELFAAGETHDTNASRRKNLRRWCMHASGAVQAASDISRALDIWLARVSTRAFLSWRGAAEDKGRFA